MIQFLLKSFVLTASCFLCTTSEVKTLDVKSVVIGNQTWSTENLNVSQFRNGDLIPEAKSDEEWEEAGDKDQPICCYIDYDTSNGKKYGKLYNWHAINDPRGLAPSGWHIPSKDEWQILVDFLGYNVQDMMKMQEETITVTSYVSTGGYYETKWVKCSNCEIASPEYKKICPVCKGMGGKEVKTGKYIPITKRKVEKEINLGWDGTNQSGFSALPRCHIFGNGRQDKYDDDTYFWSSTVDDDDRYVNCIILRGNDGARIAVKADDIIGKDEGASVRCIKN